MTRMQLGLKRRRLLDEHEAEEASGGELNLVPYLDIVTNVIMFLMMTTAFAASTASIPVSQPGIGPSPGPVAETRSLEATISVGARGISIATALGVIFQHDQPGHLPTVPMRGGADDLSSLTRLMRELKSQHPAETCVVLTADPTVRYERVIAVLDAVRNDPAGPLFPDALLAAGVEAVAAR